MQMDMRGLLQVLTSKVQTCSLVVLSSLIASVHAQTYPSRPVRMIVPASPATAPDAFTRTVAQELSARLGQAFVVENIPGAGGNIATVNVAKAAPDGYTVIMQLSTFVVNPSLYKNIPYDPVTQFQPVILAATTITMLGVSTALEGVNSVRDLIVLSKSGPGQLNYTSSGYGTPPHLRMEIFKHMTGADLTHVPFKTPGDMVRALVVGDVAAMFNSANGLIPQAKAGKVKLLAVLGPRRWPLAPDVPTMAEAGFPEYKADIWHGFLTPAGTPREIVRKLNTELAAVLNAPAVKDTLAKQSIAATSSTPEEFAEIIKKDLVYWGKVIKEIGISAE